jgi:hypothetical protein
LIHPNHYLASHAVHPILPAPTHGPTGIPLQQCLHPVPSNLPGMALSHEYGSFPQPMFASDMQHPGHTSSPLNAGIVIPASPNSSGVFDINTKWDHLFQGGGIFEMSSIFGIESEFGNVTPPALSVLPN